jgi:hypothetical protein
MGVTVDGMVGLAILVGEIEGELVGSKALLQNPAFIHGEAYALSTIMHKATPFPTYT